MVDEFAESDFYKQKNQNKKYEDEKKQNEYTMLNGILFLSFTLPAAFALISGLPMGFFYFLIIVWVHEAGHGFFCLIGSPLICKFAGFMNEMLFTLVPALICFRKKEIYLGGLVLIMCAGMSIEHNGVYMQSAQNPYGMTSFSGALTGHYGTMTEETHDWSGIFRDLGLLQHSYSIGKFTEDFGRAIAVIFFITSILYLIPSMYGWSPKKITDLIGFGALLSLICFILFGAGLTEIFIAVIFSTPVLLKFARKQLKH